MKKQFLLSLLFALFTASALFSANSGYLLAGGSTSETFNVAPGVTAVFTLKNASNASDLDIYVYRNGHLVGSSTDAGTKAELVTIDGGDYGVSVQVTVKNAGRYSASYNLYAHGISLSSAIAEATVDAMLKWAISAILGSEDEEEDGRDSDRVTTAILGLAKGGNLKSITLDLLLNEVTTELRNEVGYGVFGDFVVNVGVNYYREMYKYYFN